ncbi:MAG: hypothetical protein HZC42_10905 [Candidatus Eisenbacteria bacterium]|nr:hypothetical protein [Candidatus Eisenbacteria bacterium]
MVASAGSTTRVDGPFRRIPIGARLVGGIPVTRQALVLRDDLAARGVAEASWLGLHRVRSFGAWPLAYGQGCIGVLALFSRGTLEGRELAAVEHAVRLGALALGNLRAFRDLAAERNRLVARNARLRGGQPLPEDLAGPLPAPVALAAAAATAPPVPRAVAAVIAAPGAGAPSAGTATFVATPAAAPTPPPAPEPTALTTLAEAQRRAIERVLRHTGGRVSGPQGAAVILGLKPTTLESKMKKLGVRKPRR